jgi:hypothetical protein
MVLLIPPNAISHYRLLSVSSWARVPVDHAQCENEHQFWVARFLHPAHCQKKAGVSKEHSQTYAGVRLFPNMQSCVVQRQALSGLRTFPLVVGDVFGRMLFLPYLELAATVSCMPFWTRGHLRWIVGGHVACWRMTVGSHVAAASLVQSTKNRPHQLLEKQ